MLTAREVYAVLGNETLWKTAELCDRALRKAGVPYAIAGGVAVCLHGYQRNTIDLDLLVRASDETAIRDALTGEGFTWSPEMREFRTAADVAIQFLLSGDRAGRGEEVIFPDPSDSKSVVSREGLTVLSLPHLIEAKIACGTSNLRRTHKDYADVVELIAIHELDASFARLLHKSVRGSFRELVRNASS